VAGPRIKEQQVTYWPKKNGILSLIQNWTYALLLLRSRNVIWCVAKQSGEYVLTFQNVLPTLPVLMMDKTSVCMCVCVCVCVCKILHDITSQTAVIYFVYAIMPRSKQRRRVTSSDQI
jgi:hypothetical protein